MPPPTQAAIDSRFERLADGHYRLSAGDAHTTELEVSHVRRERYQLHAELTVRTGHVAARPMHGVLMVVDVNLSTTRGLDEIATSLHRRIGGDPDGWRKAADELGTAVALAERVGEPSIRLTGERQERPDQGTYHVLGFRLPQVHPAILFGYGDTLKSFAMDAVAVELDRRGLSVLYVDGEMDSDDHQDRVATLTEPGRTHFLRYMKCNRPLIFEAERIKEVIREYGMQYALFDSVGFLAHDKPESSDAALRYFAAVRSLGRIGSLHIAHRANSDHGDRFPFGSQFWHNSARATWYAERADRDTSTADVVDVAYHCRKFNVGAFPSPHGLRFDFSGERLRVSPVNPVTVPSLSRGVSIQQRIAQVLKNEGGATSDVIKDALPDLNVESVTRKLRSYSKPGAKNQMFVKLPSGEYRNVDRWVRDEGRT